MIILLNNEGANERWYQELSRAIPEIPIVIYPDIANCDDIHYAVVWKHPVGDLQSYTHLRAILSLGAGVDHLLIDKDLPDLPIVRLADPAMSEDIAQYVLYYLINFQRKFYLYAEQQAQAIWQQHPSVLSEKLTVGIMGMGIIGKAIAEKLLMNNYEVRAWSRRQHTHKSITTFFGDNQLYDFVASCDVLISCLPLTNETRELIDIALFNRMRDGSYFINISRGGVVKDADLVKAIEKGNIACAALDVFAQEPLPKNHLFWGHSRIYITPHIAGITHATSAAKIVAANIRRIENGQQAFPLYDATTGY